MNAWKLAAGVLLAALYGCSAEHAESVSGNAGFQGETGKPGTALAYEHRVGIRLPAARIDAQLAASRDACNSERLGQCDVLAIEQRGGIGHYAELTVRIVPDGVEKLVAAAAEGGTLESRRPAPRTWPRRSPTPASNASACNASTRPCSNTRGART